MKFPFDESKLEEELSEIASLLKLRVEGNVSLLPSFLSLLPLFLENNTPRASQFSSKLDHFPIFEFCPFD